MEGSGGLAARFLVILAAFFLAVSPALLAGQGEKHGDWYYVASPATADTSFAGTGAAEGVGKMRVLCGDSGDPVVAFLHPPLGGTAPQVEVRLLLQPDSVSVRREGRLTADRRTTRLTPGTLELLRLLAVGHDSLHVRIEALDTGAGVDLPLSAHGLREAVQRLPCVEPLSEFMAVGPQIADPRRAAQALSPLYPPLLRDEGIGDTVSVRLLIDRDGRVADAVVNEPSEHPAFNEAALEFVEGLRFTPAYNGPHRVSLWVSFDVTFEVGSMPWDA